MPTFFLKRKHGKLSFMTSTFGIYVTITPTKPKSDIFFAKDG